MNRAHVDCETTIITKPARNTLIISTSRINSSQVASADLDLRSPDLTPVRCAPDPVGAKPIHTHLAHLDLVQIVRPLRNTAPALVGLTTMALHHDLGLEEGKVLDGLNLEAVPPAIRAEAHVEIRLSPTVVGVETHRRHMFHPPPTYAVATWVVRERAFIWWQLRLSHVSLRAKHLAKVLLTT